MDLKRACDLLGLDPTKLLRPDTIVEAFRQRVLVVHPDVGGTSESFRELLQARSVLLSTNYGERGKGKSRLVEIPVPLEALYQSAYSASYTYRGACPACRGLGGIPAECKCGGTGVVLGRYPYVLTTTCSECGGDPINYVNPKCVLCSGSGLMPTSDGVWLKWDRMCSTDILSEKGLILTQEGQADFPEHPGRFSAVERGKLTVVIRADLPHYSKLRPDKKISGYYTKGGCLHYGFDQYISAERFILEGTFKIPNPTSKGAPDIGVKNACPLTRPTVEVKGAGPFGTTLVVDFYPLKAHQIEAAVRRISRKEEGKSA